MEILLYKINKKESENKKCLTFFLSLMELLPRTMILQPVSASSCLAVRPRGPRILPTKLNCEETSKSWEIKAVLSVENISISHIWYEHPTAEQMTRILNNLGCTLSVTERGVSIPERAHTH